MPCRACALDHHLASAGCGAGAFLRGTCTSGIWGATLQQITVVQESGTTRAVERLERSAKPVAIKRLRGRDGFLCAEPTPSAAAIARDPATPRTASFDSELQISDARGVRGVVRFGPYGGNALALEERQATEVPHHGPAMAERSEELVEQRQIAAPELVGLEIAAGGQHVVENGPVEPGPIAKGDRHAERVGVIVELPERQRGADPAVQSFDGIKRVQARMSAEIKHAACDSQLVGRGERQRDRDALDVIAAEWTRACRACE